jgi:hypothetical protein
VKPSWGSYFSSFEPVNITFDIGMGRIPESFGVLADDGRVGS